ncbi:MAG: dTMP kinase [Burkholderiaceae bacterium]|nr:dTMP kinase [Burkholderiaceae bacterium]
MEQERGRFITLEGVDGAGKSTQIPVIAEAIQQKGKNLVMTREPGGTELGEKIRSLLLNDPMSVKCEMLLMFASREQNLSEVIRPAVESGKWVLCDRFTDASYAYQCAGRMQPKEYVDTLVRFVHPDIEPDLTIIFDLNVEEASKRLGNNADRFESEEISFHKRVREEYLRLARENPNRYFVVDASQPIEVISELLRRKIASWD